MNFWDSSAIVPLCNEEPASGVLLLILRTSSRMAVWWTTSIEATSAIERKFRYGEVTLQDKLTAGLKLQQLAEFWIEVEPAESIRRRARSLLAAHPLRAADAMQLAAAIEWRGRESQATTFVCLDQRLREAAANEGFTITP